MPEVIDVWYDSGSMPFAQFGAPAPQLAEFEARYPAQFICEALDQTRGWFYSLMAVGTLVFGQSVVRERAVPRAAPRRRRPQDEQAPRQRARAVQLMDRHGADALRWFLPPAARRGGAGGSGTTRSRRSSARSC